MKNAVTHADCAGRNTLQVIFHLCFLLLRPARCDKHSHLSKTVRNITHSWHSVDAFINYLSQPTRHQDLSVKWPCVFFRHHWAVMTDSQFTLRSSVESTDLTWRGGAEPRSSECIILPILNVCRFTTSVSTCSTNQLLLTIQYLSMKIHVTKLINRK